MDTIPRYSMRIGGDWLDIPSTGPAGWTGGPPAPAQRAPGLSIPATGMEISWTF
jgi:hypothetical protein